jgi:hypothetical protein
LCTCIRLHEIDRENTSTTPLTGIQNNLNSARQLNGSKTSGRLQVFEDETGEASGLFYFITLRFFAGDKL